MKKIGMYGGSFNPPHLGHVSAIMEASSLCEKLYVILSYSKERDEIDYKLRFRWLKDITKDLAYVEVINVEDNQSSKETYDWKKGRDDIVKAIPEKIDIVFCGDDYKKTKIFEELYPDSEIYYISRKHINISSTDIRNNPYKNFEYLPKVVRAYYNKKLVIIGTESCGKSTLVRNLAALFNTCYIEEVGRDICDKAGGIDNMIPSDFTEILLRHKVRELDGLKEANKILFIDTDAVITLYYFRLLFDNMKETEDIIKLGEKINDLNKDYFYVFLEPDVKWIQDGTRTYGEDEVRNENNKMLKKMLDNYSVDYEVIKGDYHNRFLKTYELAKNLIK